MIDKSNDDRFMARALELARNAEGQTRPNPAVGAVIVSPEGQIIGEGWHRMAGLPHAEVEALRSMKASGHSAVGATMYVTLEPCNHTGRTGPCSIAVIEAGIRRVVVAMRDPHRHASGGIDRLRASGIAVEEGVRRAEALLLNPGFNTYHMLGRPMVTLKYAMTLDGCTSVPSGDSKWITGEAARHEVHRRRTRHDVVMAGIETVLRDDARLTARNVPIPPGPALLRAVLDSRLRLPLDAPFLADSPTSPALIFCADDIPMLQDRAAEYTRRGAQVIPVPRRHQGLALDAVLKELHGRGVQSISVEGGRRLAGSFLLDRFVDRIECWIAPRLAGGGLVHTGPITRPVFFERMELAEKVHHLTFSTYAPDFLIEGWLSEHLVG